MNNNSVFYDKTLGALLGGLIGDAMGTPTENMHYQKIEEKYGWVDSFDCDGTDDTVMKNLLADALVRTDGYATLDDWAAEWLNQYGEIFGPKLNKFFPSVTHTAVKLRLGGLPRAVALGNLPSSSSAMCISPLGLVNACNPAAAARQAYQLAPLIHVQDVAFCQDGAASMAAAVSAACIPGADTDSIITAATSVILQKSGQEMLEGIDRALELAKSAGEFKAFRTQLYDRADDFFKPITCDSRETIPLTLALVLLADADFEKTVTYGANLGRDADTIASMAGAITGALSGASNIPQNWVEKAMQVSGRDQQEMAQQLVDTANKKVVNERAAFDLLDQISR